MARLLTVGWREFLPLLQSSLPRCPVPLIISELRSAAVAFCRRTRVWRHVSDLTDVYAGDCRYVFEPPEETTVVATLEVHFRDEVLIPLDDRVVRDEPGTPAFYQVEEPGVVRLVPCPREDESGVLRTVNVLAPHVLARNCPKFLLDSHGAIIAAGARHKLFMVPNEEWTDPARANVALAEFNEGMAGIRIREMRGGTGARLEMNSPSFF
ncbi:hypothetical protein [Maridesulfovibrio sp. FT414]|uniref:hypothetical protein n=1 Tax=Maridesulfovibrio sp. FT414 TaxID=2979469 RepID=UPI003D808BAB